MTQIPFFAIDPMLESSVGWKILGIVIAKVITVFTIGLLATMFMVWFERKIVSGMQNRIGPNKAGPFGILQTVADGVKLIFKEDFMPEKADRKVYVLAPFLAFVPALLLWLVLPLGGDFSNGKNGEVTVFGEVTRIQLMDAPVGILFVLALSSIGVYGIMLAGWSSGSKYPLLGSVRASAQMISYEAALGLSVGTVLLMSGSVQISDIVSGQHGLMNWNVVATGVVPFIIFFIAMTAELNRPPFDLVEAEQELVGGFNTEYAGFQFALFFLAEFMNVVTMSAVMVTLFLGGPQPLLIGGFDLFGWMPWGLGGSLWLGLKVLVFLYVYV
ncbi:MAG: NADH-quinone oxidoreductase subunit H, partial [Ilumatobacter coccineus]